MVLVSYSGREINAKLVYYGPGLSGKTTNLEYIYGSIPNGQRGKMVSMKTKTERTLFFDFLPVHLGELSGFKTRFLLYTVPGQVYYNATRKLVLKGVDAVVFVADSKRGKMDENVESLENLRENLREHGLNLDQIPWVIQYNKRDLPDVYSVAELDGVLNAAKAPSFEAVATTGEGVVETFKGVSRLLLKKLAKEIGVSVTASEPGVVSAPAPPPSLTTPTPISMPAAAPSLAPVRPVTPTPAWSAPASFASAAAPPDSPRPVRAPEWGHETPSWDAPARPVLRPEPAQPRPAVFERIAPEPMVSAPPSLREANEPPPVHEPLPFPHYEPTTSAPVPILDQVPASPLTPKPPVRPVPVENSEFRIEALTAEPASTTLPPPAERIDSRAFSRSVPEKSAETLADRSAEKTERPNTVGERLRRWLSRNQEKETTREDDLSSYTPIDSPPPPARDEEPHREQPKEPARFSGEEPSAVSPDLSSRREFAPVEPPERPAPPPAEAEPELGPEPAPEAEVEAMPMDDLPAGDEWTTPTSESTAVATPNERPAPPVEVSVAVESSLDLPAAEPEVAAAPMPPVRVRSALSAPALSRRPREIVVPIEIHPEDLENGISLKLALQAPWWEEQHNGEELQGAA